MMAASQRRMNGLCCSRKAAALLLFMLLIGNEVMCQDDATSDAPAADATAAPDAADAAASPEATAAADADAGDAATSGDAGTASMAPGDVSFVVTVIPVVLDSNAAETTAGRSEVAVADDSSSDKTVGSDPPADPSSSSSSGSSVLVGILVTGLLAALAITIAYFKCQRRPEKKGVRLAEEAFPADQENQGNTLASVAPLNPPPETPEKPSVNGESTEAAKTQTPPAPTNGHSTAKADTEL